MCDTYLAHIYQLVYLPRRQHHHTVFCLYFRPSPTSRLRSINVLPDFLGPDAVELDGIEIDGIERPVSNRRNFQIPLAPDDLGRTLKVRLRQSASAYERLKAHAPTDNRDI